MSKNLHPVFLHPTIFATVMIVLSAPAIAISALTEAEADKIVRSEMVAKAEREAKAKTQLQNVPAYEVFTTRLGDDRVIMRRIASQPILIAKPKHKTAIEPKTVNREPLRKVDKPRKALSPISITVFNDHFSRIKWQGYTAWSNVSFSALPPFGNIEEFEATYFWFAIVTNSNTPSPLPSVSLSQDGHPEYFVYASEDVTVPDQLFFEIDLLHASYLTNEKKFRSEQRQAKMLQAARERYLEKNPPAPKETIINFSSVSSRSQ